MLLVPALVLAACVPLPKPAAPGVPADLVVVVGHTGAAGGRQQGYRLRADGSVERWEGRYVGERASPAGRLDAAQVRDLWERIEAARFFDQAQQEQANSVAFMTVSAGGRQRRVAWAAPPAATPEGPLPELYAYVRAAAEQAAR